MKAFLLSICVNDNEDRITGDRRRQLNKAKDCMFGLHARIHRHASMPCALLDGSWGMPI